MNAESQPPLSTGAQALPRDQLFKLLEGAAGQKGRNQLGFGEKDTIRKQLASVSGLPAAVFDLRTLNSDQQTSRARSESLGARDKAQRDAGKTFSDWVFVGRVTADKSKHPAIIKAMLRMLDGNSTIGILVASKPAWKPLAIFTDPDRRAQAEALADYLGFPRTQISDFKLKALSAKVGADEHPSEPAADAFIDAEELESILIDWRRKKNLILQGPPGVGKTFIIRALTEQLMGGFHSDRFQLVQFHQSTSYEDFVRGWRPRDGEEGFQIVDGTFVQFCEKAKADQDRQYVFAIDEINRANLSRVFGELLLLLDHDKRSAAFEVKLAYQSDATKPCFFVPPNVYVIATMNTADRSLATFDMAMRRRFAFRNIRPAFGSPKFEALLEQRGVDPGTRDCINSRLTSLNLVIAGDKRSLGPGFEIGHSFFCPTEQVDDSKEWYQAIIRSEISPLLREYWFDNPELADRYIKGLLNTDPDASTAIEFDAGKSSNEPSYEPEEVAEEISEA